jgi:choline dehydrogenase-like flavoprotein
MTRLVVVGSGASGVHFALTALERGFDVTMLDVGYVRPDPVAPDATFSQMPERLEDPVAYFLGADGEGVVYPATTSSYYGQPPSKTFVFRRPSPFRVQDGVMRAFFSFARGGLAEAWTAGAYEFGPEDLADFPFDPGSLVDGYRTVVDRIGVTGEPDDLAPFFPLSDGYLPPLPLDRHSALLVERYRRERAQLRERFRFHLGRSRVAVLSRDHAGRPACGQLGRCLWGCPTRSIYSPVSTLAACLEHRSFHYRSGLLATHFEYGGDGRITSLAAIPSEGGPAASFPGDVFVLAAGALASSKIYLESILRRTHTAERLTGLMDNRQAHVPFLTPAMIGSPVDTDQYQYHHLAFGLERPDPKEYIHGQITTLRAASIHPIVQSLPLDFRGATAAFRALRAGLGIANVNLADRRRAESGLTLEPDPEPGRSRLVIDYVDDPAEPALLADALGRVRRALRRLGCWLPPGMTRVLPKGTSAHYAGTLPLSRTPGRHTCAPDGRSHEFPNLVVADGATFPFLPAKNLTLTLMANATRMARALEP